MAHAYTPGLRVTPDAVIRKRRVLPLPGEVTVREGDLVTAPTEVARAELPGKVYPVNVANKLSIAPGELSAYLLKREGESVAKDETIAENHPFMKWFQTQVRAPTSGRIESISHITGQLFLREPPELIRLSAYIDGTVIEVTPGQGAVVESHCAFIQGIFGVGGETHGEIALAVRNPEEILTAEHLNIEHQGRIVVGGALAARETFARARALGVRALVVGGVHDHDLKSLLGYDLGVAITGTERIGFTLIITEGFGTIPMAKRTFDLLAAHAGQQASCSGATQIRAGVIRPEVLIPHGNVSQPQQPYATSKTEEGGIQVGDVIRIIREPYFGVLARVKDLPSELQKIATESHVRVLMATLPDGHDITLPRANVEMIEG
ncbi:MAG: hypothetical protein HYZ50_16640 [Deltaproteobacteria bacterium]|nr:hypothetical protein [Deltaproteobacteria bacterium]